MSNLQNVVTTQYEMIESEHLALRRAILHALPVRVPMLWFSAFAAMLGVAAGIAEGWEHGLAAGLSTLLPWSLIAGLWLVFGTVPFRFWTAHAPVFGKQERSLDDGGLHIRAGHVLVDLPWHAMLSTHETTEFFLFLDEKQRAHYLPKRGLRERELREAQQLIATRSPESVRRLRA